MESISLVVVATEGALALFEQLFGSKTRVKLLSLFLNNPGRPYYVREITRKIDEQINSVRRELSNLLSIGIVKSIGSNNRLYYEADPVYEHYKELRAIFAKIPVKSRVIAETKEEDQIAKKLRSTGQIDIAFLTGIFVRDNRASVDLCIVGDVNRARVTKVVQELEQDMGRELNYTIMTSDEYNYRLSLNDRFLTSIVESKKIVVIDSAAKPLGHTDIAVEPDASDLPDAPEETPAEDKAKVKAEAKATEHKIGVNDFAEHVPVRVTTKETE